MQQLSHALARLLIFTLCYLSPTSLIAMEGTLLVANRIGGSISLIDFPTQVEIARLPIGPIIPHEVDVSADGKFALTSEYGTNKQHGRHVILIDIAQARIASRIDIGPDSRPHTALFLPNGKHAVATMETSDKLALIDLEQGQILKTFPTGGREGHMVRLSPDGAQAYVTSRKGDGTLSVIFLNETRDPAVIQTGAGAEGLAVTPDGSEVWVANRQERTISIINTESLSIVATLPSHLYSGRVAMSQDGRYAIVPNGTSREKIPNYLRLYDIKKRQLLGEIALRNGEPDAGFFGVLTQESLAFVTDPLKGDLRIFNLSDLSYREHLLEAHEMPDGMAWSPVRVQQTYQITP